MHLPLDSINTPRAVAVWLSTSPTPTQSDHAFDALVAEVGHDHAMRVWITGMRIARTVGGQR